MTAPRGLRAAAIGIVAASLAACAAGDAGPGAVATPLGDDRLRVAVAGRPGESRARVERRLLVGAAEAALAGGATHFEVLALDVDETTAWRGDDGFSEFAYARRLPSGAGFGSSAVSARRVTRYAASAEVRLMREAASGGPANALDAAAIIRSEGAAAGPQT